MCQPEHQNTETTTIMDESLKTILNLLPGHYRFIASVDRRFRSNYHHAPNTFYSTAMKSDATRAMWCEEDEANVRRLGCEFATKFGNLEALQWCRSHDCRWNSDVCREAAARGYFHILHWARSQTPPCPWDEYVCRAAAQYGHLDVLQWLRSQTPPCPWDIQDCLALAETGTEMDVFIRSHL